MERLGTAKRIRGKKQLESLGFQLKEAPNLNSTRWWTGKAQLRFLEAAVR
jgi:hypothetical protein